MPKPKEAIKMERESQQFKVYADDQGMICISQYDSGNQDDIYVAIHPDQVDLLIKWVTEIRNQIGQSPKG